MWSRIRPRCATLLGKSIAVAFSNSRSPREYEFATDTSRQRLGDIYNPGGGRRVQIRDTSRRIIGYIERDGTVTNTSRQRVGTLDR